MEGFEAFVFFRMSFLGLLGGELPEAAWVRRFLCVVEIVGGDELGMKLLKI